jgi:hypothetical protein
MIALITPTGNRPDQFALCQHYMKRQTYTGAVVWIIIDDCIPETTLQVTESFRENWTIIKTRPKPAWRPGDNTQGRNMNDGINTLVKNYSRHEIDCIFFIEDDDYYRPRYLERMMELWDGCEILSETRTIYYNPVIRHYAVNGNVTYGSLFQTAIAYETIPKLRAVSHVKFIDGALWKTATRKKLFYEDDLAVGIKGLPGRGGIGAGHSVNYSGMNPDISMKFLINKIGRDDAEKYAKYYRADHLSQHPRINRKRGKLL